MVIRVSGQNDYASKKIHQISIIKSLYIYKENIEALLKVLSGKERLEIKELREAFEDDGDHVVFVVISGFEGAGEHAIGEDVHEETDNDREAALDEKLRVLRDDLEDLHARLDATRLMNRRIRSTRARTDCAPHACREDPLGRCFRRTTQVVQRTSVPNKG